MNHFASFTMATSTGDNLMHPPRSLSVSPAMKNRSTGPIRRGSITTSRNGNNSRLLGPFFCRWRGCVLMDHPFATGDAIWKHMETEHFSTRPQSTGVAETCSGGLTCGWIGCDEVRPSLFRLKSHMKKHLDWRPFGCELCDERFKHRGDQKKHLVRKHPNASHHTSISRPRTPRIVEQDESQLTGETHEFEHAMPQPVVSSSAYPAQPSFPTAIPPPPALSDYAFSSTMTSSAPNSLSSGGIQLGSYPSYPSCSSTQSAPDMMAHRDPLTTMIVSPGQFAFTQSFSNPAYSLMGHHQHLGLPYPTFDHNHTVGATHESVPSAMASMLVNSQELDARRTLINSSKSPLASLPTRETDDEQDDREREAYHADFAEIMRAPMVRPNPSTTWSPALLEVRPTTTDPEDSDVASVASLGSATPVGFDGIMLTPPSSTSPGLHESSMFYGTVDKLPIHTASSGFFHNGAYPLIPNVPSNVNANVL